MFFIVEGEWNRMENRMMREEGHLASTQRRGGNARDRRVIIFVPFVWLLSFVPNGTTDAFGTCFHPLLLPLPLPLVA